MKKHKFTDWILWENEDYVAINKPTGISSLEDRNSELSVFSLAKAHHQDMQLCHRLDKETSGILLLAKNPEAYRHASIQFEHQQIDKIYHALVSGIQDLGEGYKIDQPIKLGSNRVRIDFMQGKPSITLIKNQEVFRHFTLVACKPLTGRMHQIRIHLASAGMPIVGDPLYGGGEIYLSMVKRHFNLAKDKEQERPLISRTALHAFSLSWELLNGDKQQVEAPYPRDYGVMIRQLRKYDA